MNSFIGAVADRIISSGHELRNTHAILPTQRASTYLKSALCQRLSNDSWLPQTSTLNIWASEIAGLSVANPIELKFYFYQAYQHVLQNNAQSISDCFSWCDVLIGDFNNIDTQMVEPTQIFKELADYSEIEHFSFLDEPLSPSQERYRGFWRQLPKIHSEFKKILRDKKLGYPGLILSEAVKKCDAYFDSQDHFTYIIGFNALSEAESQLLLKLEEKGVGEVLFDADQYYVENKAQHAGLFMRRNQKRNLGKIIWTEKALDQHPIDVEICQADFNFQQSEIVSGLLSEASPDELSRTALILADEQMLIPVLSNLPENAQKANITMGINLNGSAFSTWLDSLFELPKHTLLNFGKLELRNDKLADFIGHHFSKKLRKTKVEFSLSKSGFSEKKNIQTVIPKEESWLKFAVDFAFANDPERIDILLMLCIEVATSIGQSNENSISNTQAQKAIETWMQSLNQCRVFAQHGIDLKILHKITSQSIRSVTADLIGDPMDELQIMGLLESRALGFDRVIICSVNENALPKKASFDSFIPFEISMHHGLPGKKEKEAVYAYHFYRLIQHAKNIQLVYHTNKEGVSGGERSRFVQQLEYELKNQNDQATFKTRTLDLHFAPSQAEDYDLAKSELVLNQIKKHIETRISATSINKFLEDNLNWYYTSVMKLEEDRGNEIDSASFGTLVHKVLEDMYLTEEGKIITKVHLQNFKANVKTFMDEAIEKDKTWYKRSTGSEAIFYETAKLMTLGYLDAEIKLVDKGDIVTFIEAEENLNRDLEVETSFGPIKAHFTGSADRVERRNGVLRIVDYKTGMVQENELQPRINRKPHMLTADGPIFPKAQQLMLYNWMARSKYDDNEIVTEIISLPKPGQRNLFPSFSLSSKEERNDFEEFLSDVIKKMVNSADQIIKNPQFEYSAFE